MRSIEYIFPSLPSLSRLSFLQAELGTALGRTSVKIQSKKDKKKKELFWVFFFFLFIKYFLVHPSHMTYFTFCTDLLWHLYCTLNLVVNKGMRCADVDSLCPASFWLLLCPFCYSSTVTPPLPSPPPSVSEGLGEQVVNHVDIGHHVTLHLIFCTNRVTLCRLRFYFTPDPWFFSFFWLS